ncbi:MULTISPECIES: LLM class flavin-dependent oxidoreductase [Xenorhabdus]|uniref:LLM class flavin-dependent oxidoreductase n=1 Tax=Xenorhabdus TaxID=626 RepID=UPI000649F38F|nr:MULTISPECIES: LLM class flavin-dependent oxidoreductase [Xenorhabdus]KLU15876.1 monooxygenase [Xenorhabdus griffiniae]KOP34031.1 monooxygenase [Xenorhabdus sp. GDc328]
MPNNKRKMHLNCHIVGVGQHPAGWRTQNDTRAFINPLFYQEIAKLAELGKFDALFFSDSLSLHGHPHGPSQMLDPLIVSSSILSVTKYLGFICTASTTFSDPFILARQFLTLDHLSQGRIGWNAVTTYNPAAAKNFGKILLPSSLERYTRAKEFIQVVMKLWESWGKDALIADAGSGMFADPAQVNSIDHHGQYYTVTGPLTLPRSPQGMPLLVQSGSSEAGQALAAKFADIVFTSQTSFERAKHFYRCLRAKVKAQKRSENSLKILPGLFPIIGSTLAEAQERKAKMDELRNVDEDIIMLARQLGIEPDDLKLHQPLPYQLIEKSSNDIVSKGFLSEIVNFARTRNLTVYQLILQNMGMHRMLLGTPEMIADDMEKWFLESAADGFNLNFDSFPDALQVMVDHVIPILQKRNLFRSDYTEQTIRERFGVAYCQGKREISD